MSAPDPRAVGHGVSREAAGSVPGGAVPPAVELLPGLPCGSDGPVFAAPWQAHAFALVVALHERGAFTWPEWADALSQAIREDAATAAGEIDAGERYYRQWLAALERIALARRLTDAGALEARRAEWDAAARATPHGQPIELRRHGASPGA